jgi:hypothetical protein
LGVDHIDHTIVQAKMTSTLYQTLNIFQSLIGGRSGDCSSFGDAHLQMNLIGRNHRRKFHDCDVQADANFANLTRFYDWQPINLQTHPKLKLRFTPRHATQMTMTAASAQASIFLLL